MAKASVFLVVSICIIAVLLFREVFYNTDVQRWASPILMSQDREHPAQNSSSKKPVLAKAPSISGAAQTVLDENRHALNRLRIGGKVNNLASLDLDSMTGEEILLTAHSYLDNIDTVCARKLRMGNLDDGGWEICDDPDVRPRDNCIIYSFGINYDFSFDDQAATLYKCHVYSFDPSMKKMNTSDRSALVHFYKIGISGTNEPRKQKDGTEWPMSTMAEIRKMLGHQAVPIDVIKMDVESSEWGAIPNMISSNQLDNVKQFLVEFHLPGNNKIRVLPMLKVIQSLEKAGFKRFYVHKNVHCPINVEAFPSKRTRCYEMHYIRR